jgi:3-phosphoshikimate 1-carboxyvinyltransferase
MKWRIRPSVISGEAVVPGDKSIGHRALLCAALAEGRSTIEHLSDGQDVRSTVRCLRSLGADIRDRGSAVAVESAGVLQPPSEPLDCGNSGTSMRLLTGILAGQPFRSCLTGDDSLSRRPMMRVVERLGRMGARIHARDGHAPLEIEGGELHGIECTLPVASAQVKSAVLLAGLFADGETTVREPVTLGHSRDHTEIMLHALGVEVVLKTPDFEGGNETTQAWSASVHGGQRPRNFETSIPGDPSSAAFLFAAAMLTGGDVTVRNALTNPIRNGFVQALGSLGASVDYHERREVLGEAVAGVAVSGHATRTLELSPGAIPGMIDEIPLLVLIATQIDSTTRIVGVEELRVKETDRIHAVATTLNTMGARIDELPDGFVVHGATPLHGARVNSYRDHRVAMMLAIAGLIATGETVVEGAEAGAVSWPQFAETLRSVGGEIDVS